VLEDTLSFDVTDESITTPATTNLTAICSAADINVAAGSTLTISGQPDVPRVLTLTLTDANSSTYGATFTVRGTDKFGKALTEQLHYNRGMSKTLTGIKEFKTVYEVELESDSGSGAGDTLSVGYSTTYTSWIYLAYKPIEEKSETVTNAAGTTTYSRDTDYLMDYYNGRIKLISGGSMAASTAYLIDYKKDNINIDLTSIPDLIRVDRVEYPVGDVPQNFVPYECYENEKLVVITGKSGDTEGQEIMSEADHIRVYYSSEHQPALDDMPGTTPEFLDNTIIASANAYALFQYAEKQEHQAATDLASARTALEAANTNQTDIDSAFTSMKKYLDNNTNVDAVGMLASMSTNLTAFDTAITDAITVLDNNSGADAKETLKDIIDDAANLRTAIETALDAVAAGLPPVVSTDIVAANTAGALIDDQATLGEAYLTTGSATINTVNVGGEQSEVSLAYAKYCEMELGKSTAYTNQQAGYNQTATARTNSMMVFIQEAAQRLSNLRSYIEVSLAYKGIGDSFISEANAIVNGLSVLLAKAAQYVEIAKSFAQQANTLILQNQSYETVAQRYLDSSAACMLLADKFRTEAQDRRDEVWAIWRDKNQWIGTIAAGNTRQSGAFSQNSRM
jgi:hypothetical protein